jgi:hypothetical protein
MKSKPRVALSGLLGLFVIVIVTFAVSLILGAWCRLLLEFFRSGWGIL